MKVGELLIFYVDKSRDVKVEDVLIYFKASMKRSSGKSSV